MDDLREKVIRGLECCSNGICYAGKCPYENGDNESIECIKKLAEDALSLLKAQGNTSSGADAPPSPPEGKARVMTLEEVLDWIYAFPEDRDPIFEEKKGFARGKWIDPFEDYCISGKYGRDVRCWTGRHTDAQREEAEWE